MQRREALQILNKRLPPSFSMGVTDKMLDRILGKKCFYREEIEWIEKRKTVEGGEHSAQDIKGTEREKKEESGGESEREEEREKEKEERERGRESERERERETERGKGKRQWEKDRREGGREGGREIERKRDTQETQKPQNNKKEEAMSGFGSMKIDKFEWTLEAILYASEWGGSPHPAKTQLWRHKFIVSGLEAFRSATPLHVCVSLRSEVGRSKPRLTPAAAFKRTVASCLPCRFIS